MKKLNYKNTLSILIEKFKLNIYIINIYIIDVFIDILVEYKNENKYSKISNLQ